MSTMKPVNQYDGGRLVARYRSLTDASLLSEAQSAHIGKVASGLRETAGGFAWKFARKFSSGLTPNAPGIKQIDTDLGEVIAVYRDIDVAAEMTGFTKSEISRVLKKSGRTVRGFSFTV